MKKHLYKILAGMMVGVSLVSFVGCSEKTTQIKGEGSKEGAMEQGENIPKGRFVEEAIALPEQLEYIISSFVDESGTPYLYGYAAERKLQGYKLEGDTWETIACEGLQAIEDKKYTIQQIVQGPNDTLYVLCNTPEYTMEVAKIGADQSVTYISLEKLEKPLYPEEFSVLENGDFLVGSYGVGVVNYNGTTGKRQMEYYSYDGVFDLQGTTLAVIDTQRGGVVFYDVITGDEINFVAYDYMEQGSQVVLDRQGHTYVINGNGVSRLAKGGSAWENVIESNMSSLGMPSLLVKDVDVQNEVFYVLFSAYQGEDELMRYTYDAQAPTRPTREVSIYMLEDNLILRQAAAEYQRQNPDVFIQIQVGVSQGEGVMVSDAIRTLNTQLLAGKGPDLLVLDGLPVDSYKEKGVLLDLEEVIAPVIESGEVLNNIFKTYQQDEGVYAVPTQFKLPMLWGSEKILNQTNALHEIVALTQANGEQVFYNVNPQERLKELFGFYAPMWLEETGTINEEALGDFLEMVANLSDTQAKVYENPYILEAYEREYMAYGDAAFYMNKLDDFFGIQDPYNAMMMRGDATLSGITINGEGVFEPVGIIGVNANSPNQEIAKEIVTLALGEGVQGAIPGQGLPVNKKAFDKEATYKPNIMMTSAISAMDPNIRGISYTPVNQDIYEQVAGIAQTVSVPLYRDDQLMTLIIEETKGYFDGTKDITQTIEAVSKRTKAYLAE